MNEAYEMHKHNNADKTHLPNLSVPLDPGHPNICRLEDAYEDETHVHLVMELCTGGELVKHIMDKVGEWGAGLS